MRKLSIIYIYYCKSILNFFQYVLSHPVYFINQIQILLEVAGKDFGWHEKNFSNPNFVFILGLVIYLVTQFLNKTKENNNETLTQIGLRIRQKIIDFTISCFSNCTWFCRR